MFRKQGKLGKRRGVTLIIALLVLSVVTAIGITMSTLVIFQVRLNRVSGDSHQGTYLAEAGIEQGLYKLNTLKGGKLDDALNGVNGVRAAVLPPAVGSTLFTAPSPQLGSSTSTSGVTSIPTELKENQNAILEIYDVDESLTSLSSQGGIDNVELCVHGSSVGGGQLEVSWVAWNNTFIRTNPQRKTLAHSDLDGTACMNLNEAVFPIGSLSDVAGYRVKLQALQQPASVADGTVTNLAVDVHYEGGADVDLPTQIQLKSVSTLGDQTQALVAIYPWALPLSALYDFVIFSERKLTKYVPITATEDVRIFGPWPAVSGPVPDATPFTNCTPSAACTYYVRLQNSTGGAVPAFATIGFTGSATANQSTSGTAASSCILPNAFTFTAAHPAVFSPSGSANMQYQLLTQLTFADPGETLCP